MRRAAVGGGVVWEIRLLRARVDWKGVASEDTTSGVSHSFPAHILGRGVFDVICPYCGTDNDKVIDSRSSEGGEAVRRRRECLGCEKRFTTYERVERAARLMVVKKDGSRVAWDGESIIRGIQAACGKRPVPEEVKVAVAQSVEEEIHRLFDHEVSSTEIGHRVATKLRDVDPISYIRYAIEYYGFGSLKEVEQELAELQSRPRNLPNQTELFEPEPRP